MILNRKQLNFPNELVKKFTLKSFKNKQNLSQDESLFDLSQASVSFNFNMYDGTLKKGIGISEIKNAYSFPEGVFPLKLYYYKRFDAYYYKNDDRLVAYCSDNRLYQYKLYKDDASFTPIGNYVFHEEPKIIAYNYYNDDCLIVSSVYDSYLLNDDEMTEILGVPNVRSMCVHRERLFLVAESDLGRTVWFSDDYDPTNWAVSINEGGYIEFVDELGDVLKIVEFLDYVYVIRRYGIVRLSAYGEQSEFTLQKLNLNCGRIYGETVTVCGDCIVFLSSGGLYKFNGIDTVRILTSYDKFLKNVQNDNAEGAYFNGELLLKLNGNFNGDTKEFILVYNVEKDSSYLAKGIEFTNFCLSTGEEYKLYAISNDKIVEFNQSGKNLSNPLLKIWESVKTDFTLPNVVKILSRVVINTKEEIVLIINADKKRLIYKLRGDNAEIRPNVKAEEFSFEIISKSYNPSISCPSFTVRYLKEKF